MNFGGPYVGLFATRAEVRAPDAGPAVRRDRRRGRHAAASCSRSRRASSTSAARRRPRNICTNSGLCALAFTIHCRCSARRGCAGSRASITRNAVAAGRHARRRAGRGGAQRRPSSTSSRSACPGDAAEVDREAGGEGRARRRAGVARLSRHRPRAARSDHRRGDARREHATTIARAYVEGAEGGAVMPMNRQGRPTRAGGCRRSRRRRRHLHRQPRRSTIEEPLIFEIGRTDVTGVDIRRAGRRSRRASAGSRARAPIGLPGLSEPEAVRHYVRLSQQELRHRHRASFRSARAR